MLDPVDQILQALRSLIKPCRRDKAVEDAIRKLFKLGRHTDLTDESTLQVEQRLLHHFEEKVEAFEFLKEHDLRWRRCINLFLDVVDIEDFWELIIDLLGNSLHILFLVDGTR